jgi:predicted nucleic acid-binding protein
MKACFDSNVVIDIAAERDGFFDAYAAFDVALSSKIDILVPMFTMHNIAYILQHYTHDKTKTMAFIRTLGETAELMDGIAADHYAAIDSDMPDYEDALIAYAAQRNGVDVIVTCNERDFVHSPVKALSPAQFVAIYKPANVDYAEVTLP